MELSPLVCPGEAARDLRRGQREARVTGVLDHPPSQAGQGCRFQLFPQWVLKIGKMSKPFGHREPSFNFAKFTTNNHHQ